MLVIKNLHKVKILNDFIETNIRKRGIGNPNPIKLGRCIKELERIYGIQHGATSFQGNQYDMVSPKVSESPTQEQLAEMIGISVDTLNNYKKLTELVPELQDWVETENIIANYVAYHVQIISYAYVYLACKSI